MAWIGRLRATERKPNCLRKKQHFHALKHSIATHPLDAGDLRFVQDWLGHANVQNAVIYTYLTSTTRNEKARKFFLKMSRFCSGLT